MNEGGLNFQPINTVPNGIPVYVWMPEWNGRGPLVRTKWTIFWWNEFLNGTAPDNFNPQFWCHIPEGPK